MYLHISNLSVIDKKYRNQYHWRESNVIKLRAEPLLSKDCKPV
jgi:hypothetical protein